MSTSFGIDIHPEAGDIRARRYSKFSTLDIGSDLLNRTLIFVDSRPVLDALQAALDTIRADMDAEPETVAS